MLRYTVLRLALFVGVLGLLALAGARGLALLLLAAMVSAVLSYVLFARQRDELARAVSERAARRIPRGPGVDEQAEDAEVARALGPTEPDPLRLEGLRRDAEPSGAGHDAASGAAPAAAPAEDGDGARGQSASPRPSSTP